MNDMFNKDCYICFLKEAVAYLLEDNDVRLKESFLLYIAKDEVKFDSFKSLLVDIKKEISEDLEFFMESDPAVDSKEEIIWAYPGYKAIVFYRIAHALNSLGLEVEARLISEVAHSLTGIDIHPAAQIGYPFFIDHGTGIVIGQTAIIGKRVKLYQGVTLGALSLSNAQSLKNVKRHPTIGDNVTIYSCATILGDISIGNNVTIGANVFLTESVKDNMRVILGKPSLVMSQKDTNK